MKIAEIRKPSTQEEELFLSAMVDTIAQYNLRLGELEQRYKNIGCYLISPCYFNFRDALFHFEQAFHSQETVQLYCEQNAMLEHLQRAMKDGCVRYIHIISERLEILYKYTCTQERLRQLTNSVHSIAQREGVNPADIDNLGADISAVAQFLPNISRDELRIVCEYLFNVTGGTSDSNRKLLQKAFHVMRNFELESRNSSMRIGKPFSITPNKGTKKAPIDSFFETCNQQLNAINNARLGDFLIIANTFLNPVSIE